MTGQAGTVWLWQADGPKQGSRGVSGEPGPARRAAEDRLRSGAATAAVVEEAVPQLGIRTLADGYRRTGHGWLAQVGAVGRVRWVPLMAGAAMSGAA